VLHSLLVFVALLLTGCTATVYSSYQIATDQRSLETQHLDTGIAGTIKTRLLESDVKGTGWVEVYCRRGVVVLVGVVERGSAADREAVAVAQRVEGVKRVETYFVPSRPSLDWNLRESQVTTSVLAGHVVLIGVVDHPDKVKKILEYARATGGVVVVKSFIQVAPS
jgi:hyperosmotically inducible periplasmic protein